MLHRHHTQPRPLRARSRFFRPVLEQFEERVLLSAASNLFVATAGQDLLRHPLDPGLAAQLASMLDAGASHAAVVQQIENTSDFRGSQLDDLYQMLHLKPKANQRSKDLQFLLGGGSVEQLEAKLAGSSDYFRAAAHGKAAAFVKAVLRDVGAGSLSRKLLKKYTAQSATVGGRSRVARLLVTSTDARRALVQRLFQRFVHQAAGPADLSAYVGALSGGTPVEQLVARLLSSPEYLALVPKPPPPPAVAPHVGTPHLAPGSDSGKSNSDHITNVTAPIVLVDADAGSTVQLFVNGALAGQQPSNGSAAFTVGPLSDGNYTLTATATGPTGLASSAPAALAVTILTRPPSPPVFDLSATSDTGTAGDHTTDAGRVTLVGHTDPNANVVLVGTVNSTLASSTGVFQFPAISLNVGANPFTARTTDIAGNNSDFSVTLTRTTGTGQPNAVIVWNQATLNAIQQDGTDPLFASRGLAMIQAAVFDAVNAIDGTPAYYVHVPAPTGASADAAVDAAAHDVLTYLYPAQQATFDNLLASQLALLPSGQATTDGETVGQAAASAIIALRANDGSRTFVDFTPSTGAGQWQPTPPAYAPALDPQWANLTPFGMTSPSQFRPAGPPDLTSQQWADALNQVEGLGAVQSTTRTAEQTEIAQFWNDAPGTATPPGHWNAIAATVAQQQGNSLADDARLFAELDVALADAGITAWNTKYAYQAWRPITVIQNGGDGVNPAVTADPNWHSLLTTPNFPEYVSGHSTFSGAASTVLDAFFGSNVGFTSTEPTLLDSNGNPIVRSFTGFDQAAQEAGMSRIFAGIHFAFSNTDGLAAGQAVATWDLASFNVSQDTTPPKVILENVLLSGASNTNVTLTGETTDNLSGVAKLAVQVDGGSYAPLSFDAMGKFSFTTSFQLSGTADGSHTINFRATDAAGNVATPVAFTFVLGTRAPTLTLTSPADGGTLADGATLTGTATTSGPALTMLHYALDGGTAMPVTFNTDRSFRQALDLSKLAAGPHTLTLSAMDAAGNTATQTLHLTQAAPVALTVTNLAPVNGASDVGVTFRPTVTFSRPIDATKLTGSNFYALDSTGAAIAATVVPADDGASAWLFFTNPLPSAATVTLVVDGSTIKAADGTLLDAAGTGMPGSQLRTTFTTVSATPVPGTMVSGIVADPGPDNQPMTRDDVRNGPDGVLGTADDVYLNPIAGATVYILGHQDQAVTSDAQGHFSLTAVPAGDVKVVIDGRTATNAPSGVFYPEMVFDLTIRPGVANTVMGSMGTAQEQVANGTALGAYLPRLQTSILQNAGGSTTTTIPLNPKAAPQLTPQQAASYSITVAPNSLVGMDGQKLADGQVGFSTVAPALIRGMLPQGVMQLATTLTIQAPGVATFSTPLQLTFANVYGAAAGTKLDVYSFNHTTGLLEITGTATVSADGKTVTTDPDSGITHPGWYGVTPPGSQSSGDSGEPCLTGGQALALGLAAVGEVGALEFSLVNTAVKAASVTKNVVQVAVGEDVSLPSIPGANFLAGVGIAQSLVNAFNTPADSLGGVLLKSAYIAQAAGKFATAILSKLPGGKVIGSALSLAQSAADLYASGSSTSNNLENAVNDVTAAATLPPCGSGPASGPQEVASTIASDLDAQAQLAQEEAPQFQQLGELANQLGTFASEADPTLPDAGFTQDQINQFENEVQQYADLANQIDSKGPFWKSAFDLIQNQLPTFTGYYTTPRYPPPPPPPPPSPPSSGGTNNGYGVGYLPGPPPSPPAQCPLYWLAEIGNAVLRGRTDLYGRFTFFAGPNEPVRVQMYDPSRNDLGTTVVLTGPSGGLVDLGDIPMLPTTGMPDADGDGLVDAAELVVGSDPHKFSTTGDGIGDLAKLRQCLDPTGGQAPPTGVVAGLPLNGMANAVTVQGSPRSPGGLTAYVATSQGLSVADVTNFQKPLLVGQVQLPTSATGVAVDPQLNVAAVAGGSALYFVDLSSPARPILYQTIPIPATAVKVDQGIAYAAAGSAVRAFDLLTGDDLQDLNVGSNDITGLAREDNFLYAMDAGLALHVIDLSGPRMVARGRLTMPAGGGNLFVGNGVAYVAATSGFATADVSDPDHPVLLSGVQATNIAALAIIANGSGLGLSVGDLRGVGSVLNLLDVRDPTNTNAFLTSLNVPPEPANIALGAGIAFIADGLSGLQVVNYLPFDTMGKAPNTSISLPASTDIDPNAPGIQVVEGSAIAVQANVADDVQVRNVELLVNGLVVRNDVSFPFDLSATLPTLAQAGGSTVTIQLRATDTGGNVGLSNTLTLQLVRDTISPTIVSSNVTEGAIRGSNFRAVTLQFSEPLDPATVTANTFQLMGPSGAILPVNIQFRRNNAIVQLTYPTLAQGRYTFTIKATQVTDVAGNVLGTSDVVSHFTISPYSAVWINASGGNWNDPNNWDSGVVPGPGDDVLIDVPGNVNLSFDTGEATIHSLLSKNPLQLTGGTLEVTGNFEVDNTFTLAGGTLKGAHILPGIDGQGVTFTTAGGTLDGVTANADLDLTQDFGVYAYVQNGLTLSASTVRLGDMAASNPTYGYLYFDGTQMLAGTGSVAFGTSGSNALLMLSSSSTLTLAAGITVHGGGGQLYGNMVNQGTVAADAAGPGLIVRPYYIDDTFTNQGSLQVRNGSSLDINDLSGNLGSVSLQDSSSSLIFDGNYTINQALMAPADTALTLHGTFTIAKALTATSATLSVGDLTNAWSNIISFTATNSTVNLGGSFTQAALGTFNRSGGIVNLTGTLDNTGHTLDLNAGSGPWNLLGGTLLGGTYASGLVFTTSGGKLDGVTAQGDLDLTQDYGVFAYVQNGLTLNGSTVRLGDSASSNPTYGYLYFDGTQALAGSGNVLFGSNGSNVLYLYSGTTLTLAAGITVQGGGGQLYGNIVNQGSVAADAAGSGIVVRPTDTDDTFSNQGSLHVSNGGILDIGDLADNLGTATLQDSGSSLTLDGNYTVNQALTAPAATTLTLHGTFTIANALTATSATLTVGDSTNAWSNTGSLTATNSTVNLGGSFTLAALGTFDRSGGIVNLTGTLDNTGHTLDLNASSGPWNLLGGTVLGGTYASGLVFTTSGGTLDGVTAQGDLDLTQDSSVFAHVQNGLTLNGSTVRLGDMAGSNPTYGYLYFDGTQALAGTGSVLFGSSGNSALYVLSSGTTLTLASGITVQGASGTLFGNLVNQGSIAADTAGSGLVVRPYYSGDTFTNQGSLHISNGGSLDISDLDGNLGSVSVQDAGSSLALDGNYTLNQNLPAPADTTLTLHGTFTIASALTASGATLTVGDSTNAWSNTGSLTATNSTVNLGGSFTLAALGTFNRSGGIVNLTGTLDNTGHTLDLNAGSGPWNLLGGTLTGGIYVSGLVFTASGGVLDGVTAQGDLDLTQDIGVFAYVRNGLTLDGSTVRLGDTGASPTYGSLYFDGTQALAGSGGVLFGSSGSNALFSLTSGTTLTLAAGVTVQGASGTLYGNLVNQGTIAADAGGPGIGVRAYFDGDTFTNQGTILASNGGSLNIANFQPNAGLLSAGAGGIIVIHGPFTQAAGGTTQVEIGGTNTTDIGQINVDDAVTLAGTLDLALVNGFAPVVGDSFTILTYASLSGTFDTINGTDLGGGHSFVVNYNPTDLTLTVS